MKKLKITRYCDPGHSWFKVPRKLITSLDLENKISSFSYQLGDFVYLEEDCDSALFFKALLKTDSISWDWIKENVEVIEKWTNKSSKIRNYPRFIHNFKQVEWEIGKKVKLYGKSYTMDMVGETKVLSDGLRKYRIKPTQLSELFIDSDTAPV